MADRPIPYLRSQHCTVPGGRFCENKMRDSQLDGNRYNERYNHDDGYVILGLRKELYIHWVGRYIVVRAGKGTWNFGCMCNI
jgi:hypothetical protein